MVIYDYLDESSLANLDRYKYNCVDTSPLANYVCHPFWNKVVYLCPRWVAPNLLTVLGFIACILHASVAAFYDWNYASNFVSIPAQGWLAMSFLLFTAHTLDGIDGKQARRTGTSSPLGELLDHGCDSYSVVFIVSSIYALFGQDKSGTGLDPIHIVITLGCSCLTFHICHWEKYNTGIMFLPWSYDLSMVVFIVVYAITGLVQPATVLSAMDLAKEIVGFNLAATLYLASIFVVVLFSVPASVYAVWSCRSQNESKCPAGQSLAECVRPLVPMVSLVMSCAVWLAISPHNILSLDVRLVLLVNGTLYSHIACRLIVAQMTATRCEIVNCAVILATFAHLATATCFLICPLWLTSQVELNIVRVLALICVTCHLHYAINVIRQLCDHLQIQCFIIPATPLIHSKPSSSASASSDSHICRPKQG